MSNMSLCKSIVFSNVAGITFGPVTAVTNTG